MKKKLFLAFVMTFVFAAVLAFAVSAEAVHDSTTVDYSATVTLDDGTVLPLYDENNEALIWYISGTEGGKNVYTSIRTDSSQVLWHTKSWGEVTGVSIVLEDGTNYDNKKFVVVNMMDDDVVSNYGEGGHTNIGNPITGFKWIFGGAINLEYCYLRLDTSGIYATGFQGCSKLKYINLENLTNLVRIGNNSVFNGCTSLFEGQILDLSKTKLEKIDDGGSIFEGVPLKGIILPETFWRFSASNTFKNCTSLETVVLDKKISQVGSYIFVGCTSLKAIFYVGTEGELDTFVATAEAAGNNGEITGATKISYTNYKALSEAEKASKTYIVYDYSWCDAYNDGVHGEITTINECVGTCGVCNDSIVKHVDGKISVTITYSDYALAGKKVTDCQNEGCTYHITTEAPALFTCLGYSTAEFANGGISIGYNVNKDAISEYEELTGKAVSYGLFAGTKAGLGTNDVIGEDGKAVAGAITAGFKNSEYSYMFIKMFGFNEDNKDTLFAIGAYVEVTDEESKTYSYLQVGAPNENEKYEFIKYSDFKK